MNGMHDGWRRYGALILTEETMPIEIIPAIMPTSLSELETRVTSVAGLVHTVQIDVMDGKFVPSVDWPYVDKESGEEFDGLVFGRSTLPFTGQLAYEVDLMVADPESVVADWVRAGMKRVIVHIESSEYIAAALMRTRAAAEAHNEDVEFGLAINTITDNTALHPYLDHVDFVQFMGIEKIGYQGQPFDERVLGKIRDLRETYGGVIISVDGGVNFDTAPRLIDAGANRLVSGSAIFDSEDIRASIEKLQVSVKS